MKSFLFSLVFVLLNTGGIMAQTINISKLSLDEKIAQMIMVNGDKFDPEISTLGIGGIFLSQQKTESDYMTLISEYQSLSEIKLFVAADMEGYWNPFPFYQSKNFGEIKRAEEAFVLGKEHGKILREIGFNVNFSPVSESKNNVWPGRSFTGTSEEIKEKISSYVRGVQSERVSATTKHYPGGSMIRDPHLFKVKAEISKEDLAFFNEAIKSNVSFVMTGHAIVTGAADSNNKQSSVSEDVVSELRRNFEGIIITDAVNMLGLRFSYLFSPSQIYIDAVKAGNDIVLDSSRRHSLKRAQKGLNAIKDAVEKGEISEKRIDKSSALILSKKGYKIVS